MVVSDPRNVNSNSKLAGFNTSSNLFYGLNEDVDIGLKVDSGKRRRGDVSIMNVDLGLNRTGQQFLLDQTEAVISERDLAASSKLIWLRL